ncbi:hypothetical protein LNP74_28540 [Klebsiella pneumoniae subsp. pneumoniae]|nr:hypothetical protein [Klebsiella pneumoniae subsp. pneumoniae]
MSYKALEGIPCHRRREPAPRPISAPRCACRRSGSPDPLNKPSAAAQRTAAQLPAAPASSGTSTLTWRQMSHACDTAHKQQRKPARSRR